jgi:hypothetical protein
VRKKESKAQTFERSFTTNSENPFNFNTVVNCGNIDMEKRAHIVIMGNESIASERGIKKSEMI